MALPPDLGVSLTADDFEDRFLTLHKQLFASAEFVFNDVCELVYSPPEGHYHTDHAVVHGGRQWHDFYVTGNMRIFEQYLAAFRRGDHAEAAKHQGHFAGQGHAVGPTLFDLEYKETVAFPSQGDFDIWCREHPGMFRFAGKWGMVYNTRGIGPNAVGVAWSDDLVTWEQDANNPAVTIPNWAMSEMSCKDTYVAEVDGHWLIYYVVMDANGYCAIALRSTTDWKSFADEGPVMLACSSLRGTMGLESPVVVHRNGVWHLFYTYGPGTYHAISRTPAQFVESRSEYFKAGRGSYCMGSFHAADIFTLDGDWWLTSDRKEEARRLKREAGILAYRGTWGDEEVTEEGLYLAHLRWQGDQPILEKPKRP